MRPHGKHQRIDPSAPTAAGVCDRCNLIQPLARLKWQYDWRGNTLGNLRLRVCPTCMDKPFIFNRPLILPPDPPPVKDPRPENYAIEEA